MPAVGLQSQHQISGECVLRMEGAVASGCGRKWEKQQPMGRGVAGGLWASSFGAGRGLGETWEGPLGCLF